MTPFQRLQELLRDLLQLDLSELDFGIYRLLRVKRAEIDRFREDQLPEAADGGPLDMMLINGDSTVPGIRSLNPLFKAGLEAGTT